MTETLKHQPPLPGLNYPKKFAESYLGKEALELLKLLDEVLAPYEGLFEQGWTTEQVTQELQARGIFEDLKIIKDISELLCGHVKRKRHELERIKGTERGNKEFNEGFYAALYPEDARKRKLRTLFINEIQGILQVDFFLDLLRQAENAQVPNPEHAMKEGAYANESTNMREKWWYGPRQMLTISSWLRTYNRNETGDERMDISEEGIQAWKKRSREALRVLRQYRPLSTMELEGDKALHIPTFTISGVHSGREFECSTLSSRVETSLDGWNDIVFGVSAVNGHFGLMGMGGFASLAPVFRHHDCRDFYEYMRRYVLESMRAHIEQNPEKYRKIERPKIEEEMQTEEDESGDDDTEESEPSVESPVIHTEEVIDEVKAEVSKVIEKSKSTPTHFRSAEFARTINAFTRMGLEVKEGAKHQRISGRVNGELRTTTMGRNMDAGKIHHAIWKILRLFGKSAAEFWEKY